MPEPQSYQRADLLQPNAERQRHVTAADLPLACPTPETYLWCSHPRVFLPVHESGEAVCPYCGTRYLLDDNDRLAVDVRGAREWK
ncbi:hypothetical protein CKO15_11675 [Halorhodospira abdelmalekii]|uniref:zinc-finger domain-containing protein n=1 Tax=Halorhodospira abdelmalekii TaxID=421629 RepID=UPI00190511AD|nr:zinc-finger domain-containing protein [Halorhodospira abdelmalekii]MBK1735924.1 hypothetical protein [Halorhodospira abdelmalekii]